MAVTVHGRVCLSESTVVSSNAVVGGVVVTDPVDCDGVSTADSTLEEAERSASSTHR